MARSWPGLQGTDQGTNVSSKKEIGGRGRERKGQDYFPPSEMERFWQQEKKEENKGKWVAILAGMGTGKKSRRVLGQVVTHRYKALQAQGKS